MRRLASLAALFVLASCGGGEETAGGAADLPGPVPDGVEFVTPPASALAAPDFSAELIDGTPVTASDLWRDRPVVLVFTASYCDRCKEIHRTAAEAVDAHDGAIGLLGVVGEDDVDGGRDYADELDLGHPLAVAGERVWLDYAAREPGLVVLVARRGKVLRGWPGGASAVQLRARLDELIAR
ncbi:MAG TPA: redoxin domain-containing protein [Gaiellaceae bacterium]|nr:redoxin domain-containing protein [Gaiellaceae bacterium]